MGKPQRRARSNRDDNQGTKGEQRAVYREKMSESARRRAGQNIVSDNVVPISVRKELTYLTENQRLLGSSIRVNTASFATGPAGTGKTHVAIAEDLSNFFKDRNRCLILTNPGVEIGKKLGILPGNKDDKIAVDVRPMRDILNKLIGASHLESLINNGRVMFEPLGNILGTTFDDATMILDEAQNSTPEQMKAFLTRTGKRTKVVLAGDFKEQKFIPGISGLEDALNRLKRCQSVGHIEFTMDDVVRGDFCKDVIRAYREED